MIILGLNAHHDDASACIVVDGKLIAAAEEERFRRIKHWAGFPSAAIQWCMTESGAALSDVDCVALNQSSWSNLFRKVQYMLTRRPNVRFVRNRIRTRRARTSIAKRLAEVFPG